MPDHQTLHFHVRMLTRGYDLMQRERGISTVRERPRSDVFSGSGCRVGGCNLGDQYYGGVHDLEKFCFAIWVPGS